MACAKNSWVFLWKVIEMLFFLVSFPSWKGTILNISTSHHETEKHAELRQWMSAICRSGTRIYLVCAFQYVWTKYKKKKAAICRQSSVLHCEKTPAVGACPPTPLLSIMVWFIHTDTETAVCTLSVSMATWVGYEIKNDYLHLSQYFPCR